jgi:hypothetical protein
MARGIGFSDVIVVCVLPRESFGLCVVVVILCCRAQGLAPLRRSFAERCKLGLVPNSKGISRLEGLGLDVVLLLQGEGGSSNDTENPTASRFPNPVRDARDG